MRLLPSLVTVRKIVSTSDRSQFESDKIEYLAQLILNAEGVISPLVLRRTGIESYEVIDGDLVYHAAVRAREIDARKGESIAAYIIETENNLVSDAIVEQINILSQSAISNINESQTILNKTLEGTIYSQSESSYPSELIATLKSVLSKLSAHDLILNSLQKSLTQVVEINEQIKLAKPLQNNSDQFTLNEANLEIVLEKIVEKVIVKHLDTIKPAKKSSKQPQYSQEQEQAFIDELNESDLARIVDKFSQAGYKTADSFAKGILNSRKIKPYESIEDIKSRKNAKDKKVLSSTALEKLIKIWWSP